MLPKALKMILSYLGAVICDCFHPCNRRCGIRSQEIKLGSFTTKDLSSCPMGKAESKFHLPSPCIFR